MLRSAISYAAIACALGVCGCASTGGGAVDDEAAITGVVQQWTTALMAHDVDGLMDLISNDFADADGNDKAAFRTFISDTIEQGILDDLEVATENAVLTLDEDSATYDGTILTSALGSVIVDLTLAREEDGWKIVSLVAA